VVEHLPSNLKALSLNPITTNSLFGMPRTYDLLDHGLLRLSTTHTGKVGSDL
jgi:hypothetical protein